MARATRTTQPWRPRRPGARLAAARPAVQMRNSSPRQLPAMGACRIRARPAAQLRRRKGASSAARPVLSPAPSAAVSRPLSPALGEVRPPPPPRRHRLLQTRPQRCPRRCRHLTIPLARSRRRLSRLPTIRLVPSAMRLSSPHRPRRPGVSLRRRPSRTRMRSMTVGRNPRHTASRRRQSRLQSPSRCQCHARTSVCLPSPRRPCQCRRHLQSSQHQPHQRRQHRACPFLPSPLAQRSLLLQPAASRPLNIPMAVQLRPSRRVSSSPPSRLPRLELQHRCRQQLSRQTAGLTMRPARLLLALPPWLPPRLTALAARERRELWSPTAAPPPVRRRRSMAVRRSTRPLSTREQPPTSLHHPMKVPTPPMRRRPPRLVPEPPAAALVAAAAAAAPSPS